MRGFRIPRVAMHFRHDDKQIYEASFIMLDHRFRPEPKVPVLNMKIVPLQKPSGGAGLSLIRSGGKFHHKKWSTLDVVESRTILENWFEQYLVEKIMPICYGWYEYLPLLQDWLGCSFSELFRTDIRDIQAIQQFHDDRNGHWVHANPMSLEHILRYFNVHCIDYLDPSLVALAVAECYEKMLLRPVPDFEVKNVLNNLV